MCAKHYENPTMLSRVTAKNVGDVFFETHCIFGKYSSSGPLGTVKTHWATRLDSAETL